MDKSSRAKVNYSSSKHIYKIRIEIKIPDSYLFAIFKRDTLFLQLSYLCRSLFEIFIHFTFEELISQSFLIIELFGGIA